MILAVDLGSSQLKLLVMGADGSVRKTIAIPYETYAHNNGWLEQDPQDWVLAMENGLLQLSASMALETIEVISFSGHMSGVVLLDGAGKALYPCVMLADGRSSQECRELKSLFGREIEKATGNPVIQAFSLPKLLWLKNHEKEKYKAACVWLSPKDYLRYRLTGRMETEPTDGYNSFCICKDSRTWDEDIIKESGIRRSLFPAIRESYEPAGAVTKQAATLFGLKEGTKVVMGGADMACAALGNGMCQKGDSALTLGTCASFLTVADNMAMKEMGKVTFHTHVIPGKNYVLGSHFNGGLSVNWLSALLSERKSLDYRMIAKLSGEAETVEPGSRGVIVIPFPVGSGSPYFNDKDREVIWGLHTAVTRGCIFRSQLEGVAYNLRQTLEVFEKIAGKPMDRIVLGGGGARITAWPQIICDVFGRKLSIADNPEASAIGAGYLGGYGAGIFENPEEVAIRHLKIRKVLEPREENAGVYKERYQEYQNIYWKLNARGESRI